MNTETEHLIADPTPESIPVKAVFDRPGTGGRWRLSAIVPAVAAEEGSTGLSVGQADALAIKLFPDEAEGYWLNVTTEAPAIFVHWREDALPGGSTEPQALFVTLSYNEAARLLDAGEMVDTVPMPGELLAWLTEYVNLHYQPEQKKKKGRNRPSFMPRGEFGDMVDIEKSGDAFRRRKGQAS